MKLTDKQMEEMNVLPAECHPDCDDPWCPYVHHRTIVVRDMGTGRILNRDYAGSTALKEQGR